jgi:hypothetical protein
MEDSGANPDGHLDEYGLLRQLRDEIHDHLIGNKVISNFFPIRKKLDYGMEGCGVSLGRNDLPFPVSSLAACSVRLFWLNTRWVLHIRGLSTSLHVMPGSQVLQLAEPDLVTKTEQIILDMINNVPEQ